MGGLYEVKGSSPCFYHRGWGIHLTDPGQTSTTRPPRGDSTHSFLSTEFAGCCSQQATSRIATWKPIGCDHMVGFWGEKPRTQIKSKFPFFWVIVLRCHQQTCRVDFSFCMLASLLAYMIIHFFKEKTEKSFDCPKDWLEHQTAQEIPSQNFIALAMHSTNTKWVLCSGIF